ncbi:MAG TPA: POTRA domain-containing protein, partial [Gemmatimonadaceae bacterium]|nr:POTRA domain-containing protein [Gemmatimonadaceae bacterium]
MFRVIAWAFGLGLVAMPSLSHAQNTQDQQREAPEVRRLDINGVKHVDLHDLSSSISTQASKCRSLLLEPFCLISHSPTFIDRHYLNEAEFQRDVLRIRLYYWKRGYRDATVDTSVVKTGHRQV